MSCPHSPIIGVISAPAKDKLAFTEINSVPSLPSALQPFIRDVTPKVCIPGVTGVIVTVEPVVTNVPVPSVHSILHQ